ncbi:MAG TPA: hypothetical protein VFO29_02930 [Candidatus Rubrimentiphilum sp.]|nr:hypothetical protein [Candidatus Rubrimentiphilum sp.]
MLHLAAIGACAIALRPTSAPPIILKDPYAVFAAARTRWESASYPSQLSYVVAVTVSRSGVTSAAHYHSYYDALANQVNVTAVSDEELAHPYTPHGISVFFSPFGGHVPLSAPEQTFDYLGVPVLAPNYSFGISTYQPRAPDANSEELVAEIRREFCDPMPARRQPSTDSGLKTIASVEVVRRSYVITINGIVMMNGHSDYHLGLQPVRDPGRYRLRELWIDTRSFATDQLATQGNFTQGGMTDTRWMVSFRQINGAPYIAAEHTDQRFVLARRTYDSATVAFESVVADRIPAYSPLSTFASNQETGVPPLMEPSL